MGARQSHSRRGRDPSSDGRPVRGGRVVVATATRGQPRRQRDHDDHRAKHVGPCSHLFGDDSPRSDPIVPTHDSRPGDRCEGRSCVGSSCAPMSVREQTRACYPRTEGYAERDGVRIFWERYGDGDPAFLLLPTWEIVHSRTSKCQIPYFARHGTVVTFDPRGNGRSDRPLDVARVRPASHRGRCAGGPRSGRCRAGGSRVVVQCWGRAHARRGAP